MLYTFLFLGDVVAIDKPYICGPISDNTEVCHYNGCLKLDMALYPCPKCYLVLLYFISNTSYNVGMHCINSYLPA